MVIVYLAESYEMKPFDCGDADLIRFWGQLLCHKRR